MNKRLQTIKELINITEKALFDASQDTIKDHFNESRLFYAGYNILYTIKMAIYWEGLEFDEEESGE